MSTAFSPTITITAAQGEALQALQAALARANETGLIDVMAASLSHPDLAQAFTEQTQAFAEKNVVQSAPAQQGNDGKLTEAANPKITVHDFEGTPPGEVYDQTQTDDSINDGDVINLGNGNVAILIKAWPTVVLGEIEQFHRLASGVTFESMDDGKYAASAAKARELSQNAENHYKQYRIAVDGVEFMKGDAASIEAVFVNLDGRNFVPRPGQDENHGEWLQWAAVEFKTPLEPFMPIVMLSSDGTVLQESKIKLSLSRNLCLSPEMDFGLRDMPIRLPGGP